MSTTHTAFKAILIFDDLAMKQNRSAIAAILPFRNRRRLEHVAPALHGNLINCLNLDFDDRDWLDAKYYVVEFANADLAAQQVVHAKLSNIGLLRAIRYDENVLHNEIAAIAELVEHASRIAHSARQSLRIINPHSSTHPHLLTQQGSVNIYDTYVAVFNQVDANWHHFAEAVDHALHDLDIR